VKGDGRGRPFELATRTLNVFAHGTSLAEWPVIAAERQVVVQNELGPGAMMGDGDGGEFFALGGRKSFPLPLQGGGQLRRRGVRVQGSAA
jgi:hypothetical protein